MIKSNCTVVITVTCGWEQLQVYFFMVLLLKEIWNFLSNISTLEQWMWETWVTNCALIRSVPDWQAGSLWVSLHHF